MKANYDPVSNPLDDSNNKSAAAEVEMIGLEDGAGHEHENGLVSGDHHVTGLDSHGEHHEEALETSCPDWMYNIFEPVFKLRHRKVTIEGEILCGFIQFLSCLYVLPVVPHQMARVGYDPDSTVTATALTCAVGCFISSFICNTPFIVAPPTSVSIFLAVSMQQRNMPEKFGNAAVLISGMGLAIIGAFPFVARFVTKLIPDSIQAATAVGIGLITALAGATEIKLVIPGQYTLLDMGDLTIEVIFSIGALILVTVLLHYHVKGAFCAGLFCGTLAWWIISNEWPEEIVSMPTAKLDRSILDTVKLFNPFNGTENIMLVMNLIFLYILTLNGLARGLSDLAGITKPSGAIPRGNLLLVVCGLTTMLSGYFSGPPVLLSPESAAGIKAGAKTGLSTMVCGILFAVSSFFGPFFSSIPATGTAPLLLMVGVVLFKNVGRIDWNDYKYAVPAYCVLTFIPFTYSILRGVLFGYIMYIMISFYTGDYIINIQNLIQFYRGVQTTVKNKVSDIKSFNILELHKRVGNLTLESLLDHADEHIDEHGDIFSSPEIVAPASNLKNASIFFEAPQPAAIVRQKSGMFDFGDVTETGAGGRRQSVTGDIASRKNSNNNVDVDVTVDAGNSDGDNNNNNDNSNINNNSSSNDETSDFI